MWCFQEQRKRPVVLFARYLTYDPADFRQAEYYMDSSGQYLLIALIHTAETHCSACDCGVAEGTSSGENVKNVIATATRVENAGNKN